MRQVLDHLRALLATVLLPLTGLAQFVPPGHERQYALLDLGTASSVEAVNDNGIAVGFLLENGIFTPLLWKNGSPGTLPNLGTADGQALDINNSRQIAGWTRNEHFNFRAIRWDDGVPRDLGTLGGNDSKGYGLNEAGIVVGWSNSIPGDLPQAFASDGNTMLLIGPRTPTTSEAYDINEANQIVGFLRSVALGDDRAFLFQHGVLFDLGGLRSFTDSQALAINDAGTIVGYCELAGRGCCEETMWMQDPTSFQRGGRVALDLGSPGVEVNRARGINSRGEVVGDSFGRAYLWDGAFSFLDDLTGVPSDWVLQEAHDVNDYGQIVGNGEHNGETRGYLLSPLPFLQVSDDVDIGSPILISLSATPGESYSLFWAPTSGRGKAVVAGTPIFLDIGATSAPSLIAEGVVGSTGRVDLTLSAPDGLDRIYWQSAVVGVKGIEVSNRMETLVRGSRPLQIGHHGLLASAARSVRLPR